MAVPEHAGAQVKVRVDEVATAAYTTVFGRLGLALELGWLPLLIMLAVELVPGVVEYFAPSASDAAALPFDIEDVVEFVAVLLCLNAFAVRWYQVLLFPNGRVMPRRHFLAAWARFVAYALLSLPTIGPLTPLLLSGAPSATDEASRMLIGAGALLSIAATLLVLRLSLVWPAAAYGTALGWREAWRRMRGNTWRLAAVTLLVYVPVFVTVAFVLRVILAAAHLNIDELPHAPLGFVLLQGVAITTMQFILVALGATVLTEFYRRLVLAAPANGRDR
jgi:hypothetical protein